MKREKEFLTNEGPLVMRMKKLRPNCANLAYQRGLSDHVCLMLFVDDKN